MKTDRILMNLVWVLIFIQFMTIPLQVIFEELLFLIVNLGILVINTLLIYFVIGDDF